MIFRQGLLLKGSLPGDRQISQAENNVRSSLKAEMFGEAQVDIGISRKRHPKPGATAPAYSHDRCFLLIS